MNFDEQEKEIDEILSQVETDIVDRTNILERTVYMMTLYKTLLLLKEEIGGAMDQYYKQSPSRDKLAVSFTDGEFGLRFFSLFSNVFNILKSSPEYYGSEYRVVNGIRLEEIDGIDISQLGVPTIVPASLTQDGSNVAVSLEDLDLLRIDELKSISAMTNGDSTKADSVKSMIGEMGGVRLDPLFVKREG